MNNVDMDGAIFDLDGTLLDSMPIWDTAGEKYLLSLGVKTRGDLFDTIKLMTLRQAAEYFISEYGLTLSAAEIERGINAVTEQFYFNEAQAKPGVIPFLRRLKAGGTKMCLVTATDRYLAEAALSRLGILDCFEDIITCGDFGSGKDSPAVFEYALAMLGTEKARTPVFEDAVHAAKTVKEAGFPLYAVFDESFADSADYLKALADVYIHSWEGYGID